MRWWRCVEDLLIVLCPRMGAGASHDKEEENELQMLEARIGQHTISSLTRFFGTDQFIYRSKLEKCFNISTKNIDGVTDEKNSDLQSVLGHFSSVVVSTVFKTEDDQISWISFLKGYDICCNDKSERSNLTLDLFLRLLEKSDLPIDEVLDRCKCRIFFWLSWLMYSTKFLKESTRIQLANVEPIVNGLLKANPDGSTIESFRTWLGKNVPNVFNALAVHVQSTLTQDEQNAPNQEAEFYVGNGLLTSARAWTMGLSQEGTVGSCLIAASFQTCETNMLLYRSSLHGKGMNRFWKQVEGYTGSVCLLISGTTPGNCPWLLGAMIPGGLYNKESYYGNSSCCLIPVEPEFNVLRATGRDKCYVYTHKTLPGIGYSSKRMPDGIGFGGTSGNERVWIDDEFAGAIGYAPIHCQVDDVEVWGLGSGQAQAHMLAFQQRQQLFSEQRRKVDMKAFGNWEDSPEKLMMGMVSNPNKLEREERCS